MSCVRFVCKVNRCKKIITDCARYGIDLTDDSIRKWVRNAAVFVQARNDKAFLPLPSNGRSLLPLHTKAKATLRQIIKGMVAGHYDSIRPISDMTLSEIRRDLEHEGVDATDGDLLAAFLLIDKQFGAPVLVGELAASPSDMRKSPRAAL